MFHSEVISIGDEITSGSILDTNAQWISQQLGLLGIEVDRHSSVADQMESMVECFQSAASRSDIVIITGGLGPTADDLTRQALCEAFGSELEFHPPSWDHIVRLFERRNRIPTENNRIQAMFPIGSEVVENPNGSAPGIFWKVTASKNENQRSCDIWCFPGVPSEMKSMWSQTTFPSISKKLGSKRKVLKKYVVKTFGAGESEVEQKLGDLIHRGKDPVVGITASLATISLRIQAMGETELQCEQKIEPVVKVIEESLGDLVFGHQDQELEDVTLSTLSNQNQSVAIAEWGTGGYVSQLLSFSQQEKTRTLSSEGQQRIFRGGIVIPDLEHLQSGVFDAFNSCRNLPADSPLTWNELAVNYANKEANGEKIDSALPLLSTVAESPKSTWGDYNPGTQIALLLSAAERITGWKGATIGVAAGPLFTDESEPPRFLVGFCFRDGGAIGNPAQSNVQDDHSKKSYRIAAFFSGGNREIRVIRAAKQILNELRLQFRSDSNLS